MERKIDVIDAFDGKKMVIIHDIIFKKKQYIEWKDVKAKANAVQGILEMIERLRRNIRLELLAERAGISKGTLSAIEKGVSTVSIGAYAAVLFSLGMEKDFELVALDEEEKQRCRERNMQRITDPKINELIN